MENKQYDKKYEILSLILSALSHLFREDFEMTTILLKIAHKRASEAVVE